MWFTDNENSELLSFCRKLRFYSAHSSCHSFEHTFPSTIVDTINDLESFEYLFEQKKIECETNIEHKLKTVYPC